MFDLNLHTRAFRKRNIIFFSINNLFRGVLYLCDRIVRWLAALMVGHACLMRRYKDLHALVNYRGPETIVELTQQVKKKKIC